MDQAGNIHRLQESIIFIKEIYSEPTPVHYYVASVYVAASDDGKTVAVAKRYYDETEMGFFGTGYIFMTNGTSWQQEYEFGTDELKGVSISNDGKRAIFVTWLIWVAGD